MPKPRIFPSNGAIAKTSLGKSRYPHGAVRRPSSWATASSSCRPRLNRKARPLKPRLSNRGGNARLGRWASAPEGRDNGQRAKSVNAPVGASDLLDNALIAAEPAVDVLVAAEAIKEPSAAQVDRSCS